MTGIFSQTMKPKQFKLGNLNNVEVFMLSQHENQIYIYTVKLLFQKKVPNGLNKINFYLQLS